MKDTLGVLPATFGTRHPEAAEVGRSIFKLLVIAGGGHEGNAERVSLLLLHVPVDHIKTTRTSG